MAPDDGCGDRRGRWADDPGRRPVAGGLRVVQLPRLRPRPRDHRRDSRVPRGVGNAPELVAAPWAAPCCTSRSRSAWRGSSGSEDALVLPTITHIHMSVIPLLAASGTIFIDARAHKTIYDGCQIARARGAAIKRFRFEDAGHLEELLRAERDPVRLVCMDGVNSMTGNAPDLREFARVTREHGALLYVDDAHGFGVIGERSPDEPCPVWRARQQHRPPLRRELRQPRARRRVLQGVFVAAGVHRLPDRAEGVSEGRRVAVSLLGSLAGRVARDGARRLRCQREPR